MPKRNDLKVLFLTLVCTAFCLISSKASAHPTHPKDEIPGAQCEGALPQYYSQSALSSTLAEMGDIDDFAREVPDGIAVDSFAPFVTTWEIPSSDKSLNIGTTSGYYDCTINFGDGTIETYTGDPFILHSYENPGTYTVSITGTFPSLNMSFPANAEKLKTIEQWGDIQWKSMRRP